jgi:predicted transcriptional regulator
MVSCEGITMYDPRHSFKAEAAEALSEGESVYISSDGLVYAVDNGKSDVCHGWALTDIAAGRMVTVVTWCRMDVDATQTIGARVYTGAVSGGSAPSTTLSASGVVCGFAVSASKIVVGVNYVAPADG